MYFYYPTAEGFRYFASRSDDSWQRWAGPLTLTGSELTGLDASKHDRRRWREEGILSFTAKASPGGFAIVEAALGRSPE